MLATLHSLLAATSTAAAGQIFSAHGSWLVYVGTIFAGEIVVISAFVLAGQGIFHFWTVFAFAVAGTFTADVFWYSTGLVSLKVFKKAVFKGPPDHFLARFIHRLTTEYLFLTLLFSKFIIGGRLLTILYIARTRTPSPLFALLDIAGISLFVAVLALIGWSSGKGAQVFFPGHGLLATVVVCLLVIALIFLLQKLLTRKLDRYADSKK